MGYKYKELYKIKANKLIEAKGRLSVIEQKLLATVISEIKSSDKDFKEYNLNITEISEFLNLNSKAVYEQIKVASRNLRNKELIIETIDEKGGKSFLVTGLLSSAKYKEGKGCLTVRIYPDLKPYLLAISGKEPPFTKYRIKNILKLNSSYVIRLYEILKQCEKMKKEILVLVN
ncbi:replication initiation protein [Clostridiaceae bacterium M8S5]|nr:replication initiation protein [Clostridiaceae bacterium M8S5]